MIKLLKKKYNKQYNIYIEHNMIHMMEKLLLNKIKFKL